MIVVLSQSALPSPYCGPSSDARVTYARYIASRIARFRAYCSTGKYDGKCSVNFQPALSSFRAASRAAAIASSGRPASSSSLRA